MRALSYPHNYNATLARWGVDTQAKSLGSCVQTSSDIDIWSFSRAESMLLRKLAWNPTWSLLKRTVRTVAFTGPLLSTFFIRRRYSS